MSEHFMFQSQLPLSSLLIQGHCSHYEDENMEAQTFHLLHEFPGMAMGFKPLASQALGRTGGTWQTEAGRSGGASKIAGDSCREQVG